MHRALLAVVLIGLVVPAPAGAPPAPQHPRTYELGRGFIADKNPKWAAVGLGDVVATLQEIDPATGRGMGRRLQLHYWTDDDPTLSPDGRVVAFGSSGSGTIIRVDLKRWRELKPFKLAPRFHRVDVISWAPDRLIALTSQSAGKYPKPVTVRSFDPRTGRVTASTTLSGLELGTAVAPDGGAVVLTAPHESVGTAQLTVVEATGAVRSVMLDDVPAGWSIEDRRYPGLAVDFAGGRAFVVIRDRIAEVDLATFGVTYHAIPVEPRGPLGQPQHFDNANSFDGWQRTAQWLGNGRIAVSGQDYGRAGEQDQLYRAAGLRLVDTQTWAAQLLDVTASRFALLDDTLLTATADADLAAFTTDGRALYQRRSANWHVDRDRLYFISHNFRVHSTRDPRTGEQVSRWKVDRDFESAFTLP